MSKARLEQKYYEEFLWALRHGAIPAGRIVSNAGALEHKPATSTINCFNALTPSGAVRIIPKLSKKVSLSTASCLRIVRGLP